MPHLIDAEPVFATSEKIASVIGNANMRRRVAALLAALFFSEQESARPLTLEEMRRYRLRIGATPVPLAFAPPRARLERARRHVRVIRDALLECDFLQDNQLALTPRALSLLQTADEWRRKADRMSYDALLQKARFIVYARKARLQAEAEEIALFPAQSVPGAAGRVWKRIVSVAEMRRVGQDLRNCLGTRGVHHLSHAARMKDDSARFWALYDPGGRAHAAIMVSASDGQVVEARGFRNAPLDPNNTDYAALLNSGVCKAPAPQPRARERPFRPGELFHGRARAVWRDIVAPLEETTAEHILPLVAR